MPGHHVARYCRRRDISTDGIPEDGAFRIRPGEEYLSTNWLEHFHDSERSAQIAGVRQSLADKNFRVSRTALFAVLNAGHAVARCVDNLGITIRFIVLDQPHDPSHAGIYGYTDRNNIAVAAQLAASVNPNEIHAV